MQYPKAVMSITELVEIGFGRDDMKAACHAEGQDFATRTVGGGKFLIDTEKFEQWRQKRVQREQARRKYVRRRRYEA